MSGLSSEQAGKNKRGKTRAWVETRNGDINRLFFDVMLAYADSSTAIRRQIYLETLRGLCRRFDITSTTLRGVIRRENHRRARLGLATVDLQWGGVPKGATSHPMDRQAPVQKPACAVDTDPAETAPAFPRNAGKADSAGGA